MTKIFFYGVPGTGKTHLSKKLGKQLSLRVIEGDKLKKLARKNIPRSQNPFFYLGTCQAWQEFGPLNKENAIKGLLAVRQAFADFISQYLQNKESFIFEAAFFDPNLVGNNDRVLRKLSAKSDHYSLLITSDESQHRKQFYHHIEKRLNLKDTQFQATRMVQEYLIKEAKKLNIIIIENNGLKDMVAI